MCKYCKTLYYLFFWYVNTHSSSQLVDILVVSESGL